MRVNNMLNKFRCNKFVSFPNRVSYNFRRLTGYGITDYRTKFVYKICLVIDKAMFWKPKRPYSSRFEIASCPEISIKVIKCRRFKIVV